MRVDVDKKVVDVVSCDARLASRSAMGKLIEQVLGGGVKRIRSGQAGGSSRLCKAKSQQWLEPCQRKCLETLGVWLFLDDVGLG